MMTLDGAVLDVSLILQLLQKEIRSLHEANELLRDELALREAELASARGELGATKTELVFAQEATAMLKAAADRFSTQVNLCSATIQEQQDTIERLTRRINALDPATGTAPGREGDDGLPGPLGGSDPSTPQGWDGSTGMG